MARYVEKWGAQLPFGRDEDTLSDGMTTVRACWQGLELKGRKGEGWE